MDADLGYKVTPPRHLSRVVTQLSLVTTKAVPSGCNFQSEPRTHDNTCTSFGIVYNIIS